MVVWARGQRVHLGESGATKNQQEGMTVLPAVTRVGPGDPASSPPSCPGKLIRCLMKSSGAGRHVINRPYLHFTSTSVVMSHTSNIYSVFVSQVYPDTVHLCESTPVQSTVYKECRHGKRIIFMWHHSQRVCKMRFISYLVPHGKLPQIAGSLWLHTSANFWALSL